jgi:hypothetical protein
MARVVAVLNNQAREPSTIEKVSILGECRRIGIDIAKNSFSVHGLDGESYGG